VLNCDKSGIKCDKYSSKGFHVSPFQLPTSARQNANFDLGYNSHINGVSQGYKGYNLSNSGNHFKGIFSSIGPTGAEIRSVKVLSKNLSKNWTYLTFYEPEQCAVSCGQLWSAVVGLGLGRGANFLFSYELYKGLSKIRPFQNVLSFREMYKCAVEHKCDVFSGYNLSYSSYNLSGYQDYNYNYYNLSNSGNIYKCFKTSFSSIRAILAELEASQNYTVKINKLSSFSELYKHFGSLNLTGQILTLNKGLSKIRPVKGLSKTRPVKGLSKIQPVKGLSKTRPYKTGCGFRAVEHVFGSTKGYKTRFHEHSELYKCGLGILDNNSLLHVRLIKFSIVDISVTVCPSSILSLICDHDVGKSP
jgi:hypothetical protein